MAPLQHEGAYLVQSLFNLYLFILLLRFLLQCIKADPYNPMSQFLVKATQPIIAPLRRALPSYRGLDIAILVAILVITFIKVTLAVLISWHKMPNFWGLIFWSIGDIFSLVLNLFFWTLLATAILSWLAPNAYSPATALLHRLSEPLLRFARRFIPPISGFDLTPVAVLAGIQVITILFARPIMQLGIQLCSK